MKFNANPAPFEKAFVLHKKDYSETSYIVDFFTAQHGKITLIAKGAKRARSPLKAILQPFTPLLIRFSGKSSLKNLIQAEAISLALPMVTNALFNGFYINELLMRTLANENAEGANLLFKQYTDCLINLSKGENIVASLRIFEFQLLKALGYSVNFQNCIATNKPIEPNLIYQFKEEQGFIASMLDNNLSFRGQDILNFEKLDFTDDATNQAGKRFIRIAFKQFLQGKPLKSREFFQDPLPNNLKAT